MGKARNDNGKSLGWTSKTANESNDFHTIGMAGEYAVSLITGIKINQITSSSKSDLNKGDLGRIEVKTRKEANERFWDLAVNADQLYNDRIYVLCLAHLYPEYVVAAGWTTGDQVIKEGNKMKHSHTGHSFYIYPRMRLNRIIDLFDVI
jgi:hypothetical protein